MFVTVAVNQANWFFLNSLQLHLYLRKISLSDVTRDTKTAYIRGNSSSTKKTNIWRAVFKRIT